MSLIESINEYLASLPDDVEEIDLYRRNLTKLPDLSRFHSVKKLFCSDNRLTELPPLPNSLELLDITRNRIASLSDLPAGIKRLYCSENRLMNLSNLPAGLQWAFLQDNRLTSLPRLPDNLQLLNCHKNLLKDLPKLPISLQFLYCGFNQLTEIPDLPTILRHLDCVENPLPEFTIDYWRERTFQSQLQRIQHRTQTRAARVIQRAWTDYWLIPREIVIDGETVLAARSQERFYREFADAVINNS